MLLKLTLDIPSDVFKAYESQAVDKEVEEVIAERLIACAKHASRKPLYIDDATRQEVEKLLGRNLASPAQLVDTIRRMISVKLSNVEIPIQPLLLTRLQTRCFGKPFPEFLKERVVRGLEEFAMLG